MLTILKQLYRGPRTRGALRVAGLLVAVNLGFTTLSLPRARAHAEEVIKRTGLTLLEQLGPTLIGEPHVATINGQRMSLASQSTALHVDQVLGRIQQHCRERSGGLAHELGTLPGASEALQGLPEGLRDPSAWLTSRQTDRDGRSGQVVCIARADSGGGLGGLTDRIKAFAESGDVAAIGDARYVVARRDETAKSTQVLAMWTEGSFNIPSMFPSSGDAPGSDSRYVPRPPGSRRVLTAEISEHPYALRMYDSPQPDLEVLTFYERQLRDRGYRLHELPTTDAAPALDLSEHVRAFSKEGAAVIVVTSRTPGEQTGVSLIEMGSLGFAKATASSGGAQR